MPLSEEELRLLEQMERALSAEDPKFASTLQGVSLRRSQRRRAIVAGVVFACGVALLMAGVISALSFVGVLGFLVMVGSASVGLSAIRGRPAPIMVRPHLPHRAGERWRRHRGDGNPW